jgi:hypothetical protein
MELWLRPPTTAISVLKFCSCSSFWEANGEGKIVSRGAVDHAAGEEAEGKYQRGAWTAGPWGRLRGAGRSRHLCHMDEVCDDQCPLRGCGLAENHELHPLGDAVEEGDESFQDRVVHRTAMSHETVIVLELW